VPRKPIELPPAVAKAFVKDMRAFFAEENAIKRDEIAARQLHVLIPKSVIRDLPAAAWPRLSRPCTSLV
jgi:hypothetical protein